MIRQKTVSLSDISSNVNELSLRSVFIESNQIELMSNYVAQNSKMFIVLTYKIKIHYTKKSGDRFIILWSSITTCLFMTA